MNRLGTATASKKKWALPQPGNTLGAGSVVFANAGSFDHYFLESLVLIIEHNEAGTRGVLLNHETPWKVEEMSPGAIMPFQANTVFLGGDAGRDTMLMIHGESELPGAKEIGRGVYQGGVGSAVRAVEEGALPASRFKFFYKSVEWLPGALQNLIDTDIMRLVELSPAWLFGQSGQRSSMWQDVSDQLATEDAKVGGGAAGGAPEAPGAVAPGESTGLPYEADSLAAKVSDAAQQMRKGIEEGKAERVAEIEEDLSEKVRRTIPNAADERRLPGRGHANDLPPHHPATMRP